MHPKVAKAGAGTGVGQMIVGQMNID